MTPLETEADPNIRVGPLRWGRPAVQNYVEKQKRPLIKGLLHGETEINVSLSGSTE